MMSTICQVRFLAPGEIAVSKETGLHSCFLFSFDTSKEKAYTHAHRVNASMKKKLVKGTENAKGG